MEIPSQIGFQVGLLREDRWPLLRRLFKCRESNSFSHFHTGLTAEHRSLAPPAVPTLTLIGGPAGLRRPRSALMEPLGSPCCCDSSVVYHCSLSGKVLKLLMGEGGGAPKAWTLSKTKLLWRHVEHLRLQLQQKTWLMSLISWWVFWKCVLKSLKAPIHVTHTHKHTDKYISTHTQKCPLWYHKRPFF